YAYRGYVTPPKGSPDKARRTTIREARLPTFDTILKRMETLRLGWSENLPLSQLAWGKITQARQITALLPLLTE
ncbi:hypothetical protein AB8T87_27150, partial [Klebsiella pneumoniae]